MRSINLQLSYFTDNYVDGNASSLEMRITAAIDMIQDGGDFLYIDGVECKNEVELRTLLKERGVF